MSAGRGGARPGGHLQAAGGALRHGDGGDGEAGEASQWNRELGPWGNGFDHGWADALAGRHLPAMSAKAPDQSPEAREAYTAAYHEAVAILREGGES